MGQTLSTGAMIDQLLFRLPIITSRSTWLYYVNESVRFFDGTGSFSFNCRTNPAAFVFGPGVTVAAAPADMDMGNDFLIYTPGSVPYPVPRKPLHDYGITGVNSPYKTNTAVPDHYVVYTSSIAIFPGVPAGVTLAAFYHTITVALTDGFAGPTCFTRYPDDFDDLIIDWAESEAKRIFRIVGWEQIYGRCMERSKALLDQFRTDTPLQMGTDQGLRLDQDTKLKGQ